MSPEQNHRILIVEDDPLLSCNMELILEMEGFDVRMACDGFTGLVMAEKYKPDLILCDIMMPGMDGYTFHKNIKTRPELANTLFIFVTALSERDQVRQGMLAGADDYLPKPFTAQELLAAVTTRLQRWAMLRESQGHNRITAEQREILQRITAREREVLLLVARGVTTKEIGAQLFISPRTVEVHRAQLMKKLGATNAAALARWADMLEPNQPDVL